MHRIIIIITVVVLMALAGGAYLWYTSESNLELPPQPTPFSNLFSPEVPIQSIELKPDERLIPLRNGEQLRVHDIRKDPETIAQVGDTYELYHFIGVGEDSDKPYQAMYSEIDHGFIITLLASPLKTARAQAEQDFLQRLNITEAEACELEGQLSITVNTPWKISAEYTGRNLGFSFCPGSVQLPDGI